MNLVVLHHHLNPGGVTRVIESHVRALADVDVDRRPERVLLLDGGRRQQWPGAELAADVPFELLQRTVEGLDYDLTGGPAGGALGNAVQKTLAANRFDPDETLLHWHNHALGKNASTPLAAASLAQAGYRTLLQIHDFAEDFRSGNYRYLARKLGVTTGDALADALYPQAAAIHYAVLNARDRKVMQTAGVPAERLHLLPNPVSRPPAAFDRAQARAAVNSPLELSGSERLLVYPVRGIRRKNVGELLLWAAAIDETYCMVTLAPQNPAERASFDRWAATAAELRLHCRLGAPRQLEFAQSLSASDALLTTSVAEGFGLTFLEAWLVGRTLLGRDLPEITADFADHGVNLDGLYDQLCVPTAWVDRNAYVSEITALVASIYQDFGVAAPSPATLQAALDEIIAGASIDFARLPQSQQTAILGRVVASRADRNRLLELNPKMHVPRCEPDDLIAANASAVTQQYSLARLGATLAEVYASLLVAEPTETLSVLPNGGAVLAAFLSVDRLHPIRVES